MITLSSRLFAIAAMSPDSPQGVAIKLLAEQASQDEKRRAGQRARTAKSRAKNVTVTPPCYSNVTVTNVVENQTVNHVTVTSTTKDGIYVEPMSYVKTRDVETTELMLNQVPLNQVSVSRARARKKPGTQIPDVWPTEELIQIGVGGFDLSRDEAQNELNSMKDWALAKDERRSDWKAFARNWFRTAKKRGNYQNGQRIQSGIMRSAKNYVEIARRFETGDLRGGTSPPHVRLLPER